MIERSCCQRCGAVVVLQSPWWERTGALTCVCGGQTWWRTYYPFDNPAHIWNAPHTTVLLP